MLIALTGYKGSGKDTCADYLVEKYGYTKIAFASPLKDLLKLLFLYSDDQLYGHLKEVPDHRWYGCSPRASMQYIGTEWIRKQLDTIMPGIGEDYFVNRLNYWYQQQLLLNPNIKVVISDLRHFQNEIDLVKKLNAVIVEIDRPQLNKQDTHQSEQRVNNVDETIINDNTLDDFYNKIDELMKNI